MGGVCIGMGRMTPSGQKRAPTMPTNVSLSPANLADFEYNYRLCELTMRGFAEADFGDCFEAIAHPIITALLTKGLFFIIEVNGLRVGAVDLA